MVKYCSYGDCNSISTPGKPGYDPNTKFYSFPQPCLFLREHGVDWDTAKEKHHLARCLKCKLSWEWMVRCRRNDAKFSTVRRMTHNYRVCSKHFPPIEGKIDFHIHKPSSNPPKPKVSKYKNQYPAAERSIIRGTTQRNALSRKTHVSGEGSSDSSNRSQAQEEAPEETVDIQRNVLSQRSQAPGGGSSNHFETQEEDAEEEEQISPSYSIVDPAEIVYEDVIEKVPSGNIIIEPADDILYDAEEEEQISPSYSIVDPADILYEDVIEKVPSGDIIIEPAHDKLSDAQTAELSTSQKGRKTGGTSTSTPAKEMKDVGTQTAWLFSETQTKTRTTQTSWAFPDVQAFMVKYRELQLKKKLLEKKIAQLEKDIVQAQEVSAIREFEIRLKSNDKMCKFYTGLNNGQLKALNDWCNADKINYWGSRHSNQDNAERNRRKVSRKLTLSQEFLLFFLRLRGGLLQEDIAYRFNLKTAHVSRVVTTLIQFLYTKFDSMRPMMFPSRHEMKDNLPPRFRGMKNIRIIIDCAEIFCERPTNFEQQGNLYSEYKAHTTFKVLLGCTPYGSVCFVSDLFEGSISDRAIVEKSGLIDVLEEGDLVLADRGFTVKDLMDQKGVSLKIPAFLKGRDRLTPQEELSTKEIAANRIFIEHTVKRLKDFRMFRRVVPQSMRHVLSQAVFVCACLQNFLEPQIS